VNNEYKFSKDDIFIVNGGEPTTSTCFENILDYLLATEINISVYTNGRSLSKYLKYTHNSKIRWIIAFYGLYELHDKYTGRKGSFLETFNSLQSVPEVNRSNFSIKFLLEDESQIEQFKELADMLNDYDEIHISLILRDNLSKRFELAKSVLALLSELLENRAVKLSNIPLCYFAPNIESISMQNISAYYFLDENGNVKRIDYDKNHNWLEKCNVCPLHNVCCDNSMKYRVLKLFKNKISLEVE
jgi:hypothetical protein